MDMSVEAATAADGVHQMVPREQMSEGARKVRDFYAVTPGAPFIRKEFGYYCIERWQEQGMPQDVPYEKLFDYDPSGEHGLGNSDGAKPRSSRSSRRS